MEAKEGKEEMIPLDDDEIKGMTPEDYDGFESSDDYFRIEHDEENGMATNAGSGSISFAFRNRERSFVRDGRREMSFSKKLGAISRSVLGVFLRSTFLDMGRLDALTVLTEMQGF